MAKLTYYGHSCFIIETDDGTEILIDPFFADNPHTDVGADEIGEPDYVLCTHGHFDHFAEAIPIVKRTGATLVSTFEIVSFAQEEGVENAHPMHIGGGFEFPFGYVKMTPALHGGQVAGDDGRFTTVPGGFWIDLGPDRRIYHAGDTALLMDMQLLSGKVDIAMLPIGDNFTMGPDDAVRAVEFIQPRVVIPIHYDTFEPIRQDPQVFRTKVGDRARVEILEAGSSYDF